MRIVYVAGLFTPVLDGLKSRFKTEMEDRSIVWIPQFANGDLDINRLKGNFLDAVRRGASDVLICLFYFRPRQDYVLHSINQIVDVGKSRSPGLQVRIEVLKNARDLEKVVSYIQEFKPSNESPIPSTLDNFEKWVDDKHAGKVFLHPRAVNAIKKSKYHNAEHIYSAINFLGDEYWEMRTSSIDGASERCRARLQELGLELQPSISSSRAGEQGDEYFVTYPPGTKTKCLLEQHLKKGSDREERFCLRVYFFWDDKLKRVVVGWLPSHLDTRAT